MSNYSDRTLHGIFEAASEGKLKIDPKAWSPSGTGPSPFPAQVNETDSRLENDKLSKKVPPHKPLRDDPRDDLSGMDVARKIESLYPEEMGPGLMSVLHNGIVKLDQNIEERVKRAASNGCVLRYVCVIDGSSVQVGIREVAKDSPLGQLRGSDNIVSLCRYFILFCPLTMNLRTLFLCFPARTISREIKGVKKFNFIELSNATNGFDSSTVIGRGSYGKVYKGILISSFWIYFQASMKECEVCLNLYLTMKT